MHFRLIILMLAVVVGAVTARAADEPTSVTGKDGQPAPSATDTSSKPDEFAAPRSIEELAGTTRTEPAVTTPAPVDWEPVVQAMQLMIDQQKLALKSMEQSREEAAANSQRNTDALETKISKLDEALAAQRTHEAETINRMNRLVVGVAAGFAGVGFVVMVLTAWFFMRTMNKVAEINANIQSQLLALPHTAQQQQLGNGGGPGNQRLLGALEELERRIRELEHTSSQGPVRAEGLAGTLAPTMEPPGTINPGLVDLEPAAADESPSTSALMAKGQTLLNLDDAEQALECFNAVLKQEPRNADALVKKGTALERLRRMQEALDAYDAALQEDDSLTMAYLAKGGICNRLERYAEALECYERALRVQQGAA